MSASAMKAGSWQAINWVCHAPTTVVACDDSASGIFGSQVVIAECSGHGKTSAQSVDHARMVAALPDLVAALMLVRRALRDVSALPGPHPALDEALSAADAALAKVGAA